ncbi:LysR substrate-binding domain-containing protein [Bosea robiniae]|uniref:DNA-binding transcriptional regulator, LysR family n=1 Tax=Bosea robiniae TaxID=1036780 RepID=A0ABY0P1N5_9HYPH|nr:LysR substrate-binding domain-containing protein [Bosea robiniae]SDG76459.1 DNA-binding transcriptional regulator, LysR family [Bosea robiniae]
MTLEQLRIFVAVAEREHLTQGARALNLTQSAVSSAITTLEGRYATKLFDRIGRRIALTEAGKLFLIEARAVLARATAAEAVLSDLSGLARGSLALVASQTVANYWLPPVIQRFRREHPGIAVSLAIGNTETVSATIRDGVADLGFIEGEIDDPALSMTEVDEDELVIVVPAGHPWAKSTPSAEELSRGGWVLREAGSGTRAMFEAALPGLGLAADDLSVALELPSNEAICAAVAAGAGATAISRLVAANAIAAGRLATVALPLPKRRFLALRHKERYLAKAAAAFLALSQAG